MAVYEEEDFVDEFIEEDQIESTDIVVAPKPLETYGERVVAIEKAESEEQKRAIIDRIRDIESAGERPEKVSIADLEAIPVPMPRKFTGIAYCLAVYKGKRLMNLVGVKAKGGLFPKKAFHVVSEFLVSDPDSEYDGMTLTRQTLSGSRFTRSLIVAKRKGLVPDENGEALTARCYLKFNVPAGTTDDFGNTKVVYPVPGQENPAAVAAASPAPA